jgi:2',3'-cyclic-nucleotide 2'-phosphodiesterase (5'-nucleotidase family)
MPDNPPVNKGDNSSKSSQPPPVPDESKPRQQPVSWRSLIKINTLNVLLVGFVLLVALALYLGSQPASADASKPSTELIVVQLNDIYRLDAVRAGTRGGLARVVSLIRQIKDKNPQVPVIVLHAGDFLSPSLESSVFHGSQMIDAMNFIHGIARLYVVPGNHEFDYKDNEQAYLADAIQKSKFQWVASNIERNDPSLLSVLGTRISQHLVVTHGKVKLGIFGLTIDGAHDGKDRSYAAISGDYARIARQEIEYLEGQDADLIVGLTHLNIGDDQELAKLKQQHPRFLWIAGGHEHSLDREPGWSGGALITKGDSNARTVWTVSVLKNGQNIELHEESIPIDRSIPADPAFTQDIENFYRMKLRNVRPYLDTVIASIPNRCYDGTEEAVRDRESDWGDYLTDTMRKAYPGMKVDAAVLNGGSIRIDDTICDRITFENLERTFAYPSPVVLIKLKGADLRKYILEESVGSKRGDGRFLQISGVSFRRDFSAKGEGILRDLQMQSAKGWVAFSDTKTYVVAVNEFIFGCGDGYKFKEIVTDYIPKGPDLRSLTYAALSAQTKKVQTVGRIIDVPDYIKLPSAPSPKWQTLAAADKPCPSK